MFDSIARSMTQGVMGNTHGANFDKVKFPLSCTDMTAISNHRMLRNRMINVPMTPQGPDMDMVEKLVSEDASIKGSGVCQILNPQGYAYSAETVERFASETSST